MAQTVRRIGKYELLEELGRGGFAIIYKARDTRLGREVALKVIKGNFAQDQAFIDRFKAEVQMSARLRHPNIVAVHDFDDLDGVLYLVMELIEGRSLRAYLDEYQRLSLAQVAAALDYLAGQQLVHRDIKPANILLEQEIRQPQVKLTDFGLVRSLESSTQLTQSASVLGTPAYMSPEQADAQRWGAITPAADIYALGVMAYEMLAGRLPFGGETLTLMHAHAYDQPPSPLQYVPDLGADVADVLLRALAKPPQLRPSSAGEFVAVLQQVQHTRQQQVRQQSELAQLARSAKEWLKVQGLCVQIMQIDCAHAAALAWMTEAATELQRENAEEVFRRQRVKRYEEGEAALNVRQWQVAITAFEEVAQGNPDFREVQPKLAQAREEWQRSLWYDEAIAQGEAQQWPEAASLWLKVLQGRLDYRDGEAARRLTEAVRRVLDLWLALNETAARNQQELLTLNEAAARSQQELLALNETAARNQQELLALNETAARNQQELLAARRALDDFDALATAMNAQSWATAIELAERLLQLHPDLQQPGLWLAVARRQLERDAVRLATPAVQLPFAESRATILGAERLTWLVDGKGMVRVPAGEFLYGDQKEKINLPEFWIDQTPVTNAEFERFVKASNYKTTAEQKGSGYAYDGKEWKDTKGADWRHPHGPKTSLQGILDHPVVQVSWADAAAYARWAGKRLPTEQEWEKAARGVDGREYPWGDRAPTDQLCNFNMNVKATTPVGKYSPQGDSPDGCVDMAGNVWDWTASDYDKSHKVLCGGSWLNIEGSVRAASRFFNTPADRFDHYGFRCVAAPGE
jgi:formylglycine-generating enzyme required for sulfatase activity